MNAVVYVTLLVVTLVASSTMGRNCGTGGAMFNAPVYVWGTGGPSVLGELEREFRSDGADVPCLMSRIREARVPFVAVAASSADLKAASATAEITKARASSPVGFFSDLDLR